MNKQKSKASDVAKKKTAGKTAKKQSWVDVAVRGVAFLSASTLMGMGGYFALSAHSLWPLLIPGVLPGALMMLPVIFGVGAGAVKSRSTLGHDGAGATGMESSVGGQPLVGFFDADGNAGWSTDEG